MMNTTKLIGMIFAAVLVVPLVGSTQEYRTLTSTDGKQLEAKVIKVAGADVVIQAKNGRSYTLPASKFSPDDQAYFKKVAEDLAKNYIPRLEIDFKSGKGDRRTEAYFDDRTVELQPSVDIESREQTFELQNATATVMMIGKHVTDRNNLLVISKEEFKLPALPAGKTATLTGQKYKLEYDDRSSIRHGHRYAGYLVVVKNESGRVISKAGTTAYIDKSELLLKLKKGQEMDRSFKVWDD